MLITFLGEEIIVNKTFSRTLSTEGGTSVEVLQSSEKEGGASVTLDFNRNASNKEEMSSEQASTNENSSIIVSTNQNTASSEAKSFLSDSGVMITELWSKWKLMDYGRHQSGRKHLFYRHLYSNNIWCLARNDQSWLKMNLIYDFDTFYVSHEKTNAEAFLHTWSLPLEASCLEFLSC